MNRRRRTEILIRGNAALSKKLADEIIDNYECREVVSPQQGLTMIKMRETAKNSLFYIGEVLVTEVKVEIHQQIGIGLVVGIEEELAKNLAIIDAAYKAELPETAEWKTLLLEEELRIKKDMVIKQAKLMETKVNFETMEV